MATIPKDSALTINQLIIAVRENVKNPQKNNTNSLYKSDYADLTEVLSVLTEAFPEGTTFTQPLKLDDSGNPVIVLTIWTDKTSKDVSTIPVFEMDAHKGTNKLQMVGQSITYLRRYQLKSFFGLGDVDDDGNNQNQQRSNSYQGSNQSSNNVLAQRKANKSKINQIDDMIRGISDLTQADYEELVKATLNNSHLATFEGISNDMADKVIVYLGRQINRAKQKDQDRQSQDLGNSKAEKEETRG